MTQEPRDTSAISYREATTADVETLADLRWRMETERHPEHPATEANHAAYLEAARQNIHAEIAAGRHIAFLAEADGEAVACAILIWWMMLPSLTDLHRKRGYVSSVYTDPAWRRNGVARALMERLIARAEAMDVRRLILNASEMGRPLYLDLGFAPSRGLEWNG
jgi:GNAT superfamily N-acetyltransferase